MTHQGTTFHELNAQVDNVLALSPRRRSSVDRINRKGWVILISARSHLCAHVMQSGDILAWWIMADLQDELISEPVKTCIAPIATNWTGEEAVECGRPAIGDSGMCEKHLGECGV